jgi:hypothetical protein
MPDLSPTMQDGLNYIRKSGGAVERRQGGFWVKPSEGDFRPGIEYVAPRTVYALETRGYLSIAWTAGVQRASLTQQGINSTNGQGANSPDVAGVAVRPGQTVPPAGTDDPQQRVSGSGSKGKD